MKRIISALCMGLLLVGCSSKSVNQSNTTNSPISSAKNGYLTLEQAQSQLPFKILLPDHLPHEMTFLHAMVSYNPNNNKPNAVNLTFSSPDKKWILEVDEREGTGGTILNNGTTIRETINNMDATYAKGDKTSSMLWTNGKVKCFTFVPVESDMASEQALVNIAKSFK